ncbi:hypothetical protein X975_21168, partial [Stegodyphus mimosarum]
MQIKYNFLLQTVAACEYISIRVIMCILQYQCCFQTEITFSKMIIRSWPPTHCQ